MSKRTPPNCAGVRNHAIGCSICADITQDTMTMLDQGKTVKEIHDYVDQTYAKYGPSTGP
jgi:hypothetical protein